MPSKKSQRKHKRSKTVRRRYKKGGCGSCNSTRTFLTGGSSLDLAINQNPSVIPYNNATGSQIDPRDSSTMIDSRMQPNMISGGKKKFKSRRRKLKGGNAVDPSAANAISSFGNTTGLSSAYNIITASQGVDPSVTNQPIGTSPFGPHNPALV
jgi:hypothetical protein